MRFTKSKYWQKIKKLIPHKIYEFLVYLYFKAKNIRNSGNNVFCNVCDSKQARFISKSCGNCGAAVRHRTVWLFLQRKTNLFDDNLKLLHFAPEFCFVTRFKKKENIEYVSADLNAPRAMKKIDISNIPFSDNHFDVSISIDVLDDVDDDLKAIEELYRITKPNGWGIHLSPINYNLEATFEDPSINAQVRSKVYSGRQSDN